jgi:ABC-type microcin C transport system duplicated ATPase subunit YejF
MTALLTVEGLRVGFASGEAETRAVDGVDFEIHGGETFALVGESGSGKSVSALSVLRLLPSNGRILGGKARLDGEDLFDLPESAMQRVRGRRIGIIFQDPMACFNPVMTVGAQIAEAVALHRSLRGATLRRRVVELLEQVGIPDPEARIGAYPHQLSGGQRQRAMIALALAGEPDLLIADEPTTALDVTLQAQILRLLKDLQVSTGMALWLISHDLAVVAQTADRVAVMQAGRIVEQGACEDVLGRPHHPYTQQLLAALPCFDPDRASRSPQPPLLEIEDFRVYYPVRKGILQRVVDQVRAVDGVSFTVQQGRTLALVGESGCGKTTLGKALLDLLPVSGGSLRFEGADLLALNRRERRAAQARLQIVFQDPFSSMNPRLLVGEIIAEGLNALYPAMTVSDRDARVAELLEQVGLPAAARGRYPHEFSGGQRQRICIARALAVRPRLIVCDEPTSALDVSVQAQIVRLLRTLQERDGLSYLFISHDLAVVAELADEIAVMWQGKIVERGDARQILSAPQHSYTQRLIASAPGLATNPPGADWHPKRPKGAGQHRRLG